LGEKTRKAGRKGDQRLIGTAAELTAKISEHEERETMLSEQRQHAHREHHDVPISRLVRVIANLEEEHRREWDKYLDETTHHHTRMSHLDGARQIRKRQHETFEQLFERPKEVLLANADFRELQAALRAS
jgi:hypothetical protein